MDILHLPPIFIGSVALLVAGMLVRAQVAKTSETTAVNQQTAPAIPVSVARVERRAVTEEARFHGFITPYTELTIAAKVSGEIVEQWIEISDHLWFLTKKKHRLFF